MKKIKNKLVLCVMVLVAIAIGVSTFVVSNNGAIVADTASRGNIAKVSAQSQQIDKAY